MTAVTENTMPDASASTYAARHPQPNRVTPTHPFTWLLAGWRMLAARPLQWGLMCLATFLVLALFSAIAPFIPVIGPASGPVALVVLSGGLLFVAQRQAEGDAIYCMQMVEGARAHWINLALVGVLYSIPIVVMSVISMLALGGSLLAGLLGSVMDQTLQPLLGHLLTLINWLVTGWLFTFAIIAVMIMALVFAPPLIIYRHTPPLDAILTSLRASLSNLWPVLLFCLLLWAAFGMLLLLAQYMGVLMLLLIPAILMPVSIGALRQAYLDIFTAPTLALSVTAPPTNVES